MLTIKNYTKLYKRDIGSSHWRVGKVEQISTAYLIQLNSPTGRKMQVMLERIPVKSKENLYELWCWNSSLLNNTIAQTATPIRIMLKLDEIKNIDKLTNSIKSLTAHL